METKGSQESLQSRLWFFHHGRLFSSDRDDSSDSDDYLETGLKAACKFHFENVKALIGGANRAILKFYMSYLCDVRETE